MPTEFEIPWNEPDRRPEVMELFANIQRELTDLERLLEKCNDHWIYEDKIYRFYHQSFKVFHLQSITLELVNSLKALLPSARLNACFLDIVAQGTGKEFKLEDNDDWLVVTRPILEAFFHARFFLEMVIKYGKALEFPPRMLPSGWAAILCLYNLRHDLSPAIADT